MLHKKICYSFQVLVIGYFHFYKVEENHPPFFELSSHLYQRSINVIYINNESLLERITINPKVMVGKPVIQGTRLTLEHILGLLANGTTMEEYPGLVKDDIRAAVQTCPHLLEEMIDERKRPDSSGIWNGSRTKVISWSFRGSYRH